MKMTNLLQATLIALSIAGAAQASTAGANAAAPAPAPAVIVIDHMQCDQHAPAANCELTDTTVKNGQEDDLKMLADESMKQRQMDSAAAPVPEPYTFAMMALGLVLLVGFTSARRQSYDKFSD